MKQAARSAQTRQRLLAAAAEVFAADGFRNARIQTICRRAGANIAAAHYHFGDKQGLYAAVFEYAEERATRDHPPEEVADGPPDARLRSFVTAFLGRLLDADRPAWFARLLAREMIDPTPALDRLVQHRMRANHRQLADIVRTLVGADAPLETVNLCVLSVVSQCVFYRNCAPIVARLYPELAPAQELQRIADHVTRFSLAAIAGLRGAGGDGKRAPCRTDA
ncbi:CerR family C-terminal domain-containing protein [bacterium]|nr:CerR family C-terminal domain-containing protein [bacterium]